MYECIYTYVDMLLMEENYDKFHQMNRQLSSWNGVGTLLSDEPEVQRQVFRINVELQQSSCYGQPLGTD